MLEKIKNMFGLGPKVDFAQLIKEGAIILDVRSKGEFASGHIKGATNISVDTLNEKMNQLNKEKVIITCCASGMRSAAAKSILQSKGFKSVFNGGGWMSLQKKLG